MAGTSYAAYQGGAFDDKITNIHSADQYSHTVSWAGSDTGSGMDTYEIYVSDNGGEFSLWLSGVEQTQWDFAGELEHTYAFFSQATDRVGNRQPIAGGAQATTTVEGKAPQPGVIFLPLVLNK